jgi:transposase
MSAKTNSKSGSKPTLPLAVAVAVGKSKAVPSAKQVSWLLFLPPERLKESERQRLALVLKADNELILAKTYDFVQRFNAILAESRADGLEDWLKEVEASKVAELKNFALGVWRDFTAVQAGLTQRWSQGVVEGKVNKLKLIKRKLYGRANFELLRRLVLAAEND